MAKGRGPGWRDFLSGFSGSAIVAAGGVGGIAALLIAAFLPTVPQALTVSTLGSIAFISAAYVVWSAERTLRLAAEAKLVGDRPFVTARLSSTGSGYRSGVVLENVGNLGAIGVQIEPVGNFTPEYENYLEFDYSPSVSAGKSSEIFLTAHPKSKSIAEVVIWLHGLKVVGAKLSGAPPPSAEAWLPLRITYSDPQGNSYEDESLAIYRKLAHADSLSIRRRPPISGETPEESLRSRGVTTNPRL